MDLKNILAVLKVVLHRDGFGGELAELAHWHEANTKGCGNRCTKDEAARFDADDHVGLQPTDRCRHRLKGGGEGLTILQEGGDIAKDDPFLRKVGDRSNLRGELFRSHRGSLRERRARRVRRLPAAHLRHDPLHEPCGEAPRLSARDPLPAADLTAAHAQLSNGVRHQCPSGQARLQLAEAHDQATLLNKERGEPRLARTGPESCHFQESLRLCRRRTESVAQLFGDRVDRGVGVGDAETSIEVESLPLVSHIALCKVCGNRKVDERCGATTRRLATLATGATNLDRIGEELRVEIEANRRNVSGLFAAEQVARTTNLKIRERQLEASAEV